DEQVKETYDFDTFYRPDKWQPMLEDADYQEMEEDMKRVKSAEWANELKKSQLDLDEDEEEDEKATETENQASFDQETFFDDLDYEAKE
ncbi:hypothetical protein BV898_20060, partial [Hypsibius exemplaris]